MDVAELLPDADVSALLAYTAVLLANVATLEVLFRDVSVKVDALITMPTLVWIDPLTSSVYCGFDVPIPTNPNPVTRIFSVINVSPNPAEPVMVNTTKLPYTQLPSCPGVKFAAMATGSLK